MSDRHADDASPEVLHEDVPACPGLEGELSAEGRESHDRQSEVGYLSSSQSVAIQARHEQPEERRVQAGKSTIRAHSWQAQPDIQRNHA